MEQLYALSEIGDVANTVIDTMIHNTIIFKAPMGAGKTTFIKVLCKKLGITDQVSSPTFSLVNEYKGIQQDVLHFDLYRIESVDELYSIGMDDYVARPDLKLIEWPEHALPFLEEYHTLVIDIIDEKKRKLTFF